MPLVSKSIPNIAGGISQQPPTLRHWSQVAEQINAYSSLVNGVYKRPPSTRVAKLRNGNINDAFVHTINRDGAEKYVVVVTNGDIQIWDTNGNAKTVNFPSGKGYLTAATPRTMFKMVTIDDYSVLVNTTVVTAMTASVTGGTFKGYKQLFTGLPTSGMASGDIWAITGDQTTRYDDYYVKWDGSVWRESPIDGITYQFDATKMPWKLVKNGDGTFTFDKITWNDRGCGNAVTAPNPSFIGKVIRGVFFAYNRLGFISGESVSMSRSGDFFNFWPKTVTQVLDTDRIDVTVAHNKVCVLKHVVPFNNTVLLFSDLTQFVLQPAQGAMSPKTVTITVAAEYESSSVATPEASGNSVFLPVERSTFFSLREFYVTENSVTYEADNVTAHVPKLIPNNVFKLASYPQEDILFCLSLSNRNTIYVYKSHWGDAASDITSDTGGQRLQSCWSKWTLDADAVILNAEVVSTYLYLVVDRGTDVDLERIDLQSHKYDTGMGYIVHLDRRQELLGSYDPANNWTTWTLGFSDSSTEYEVVLGASFEDKGQTLTVTRPAATTIRASGNWSAYSCFVGRNYTFSVTLSPIYMRDRNEVVLGDAILKLRNMKVLHDLSGRFTCQVTPYRRDTWEYDFTGHTLGTGSAVIGAIPITSGIFHFPVISDGSDCNITITSNSQLPVSIQSLEWTGLYTIKSQRI